jgi:Tol biopolymer transport system component/DNA-binding winged helix-turn-helix (wHTH) protein
MIARVKPAGRSFGVHSPTTELNISMEKPAVNPNTAHFGLYEVDLDARELRKSGVKVKLHDQPFQVLAALLESPGDIVTRDELHARLWPADTFVDFDLSLNSAVKKLRQALGDDSDNPRFIETLYRRGYRFIAPVSFGRSANGVLGTAPSLDHRNSKEPPQSVSGPGAHSAARSIRLTLWAAMVGAFLLLSGLFYAWSPRTLPRIVGYTQLTSGGKVHELGALVTDGRRLYFQATDRDRVAIGEVSVSGGESTLIPSPFENSFLADVSPDGASLLISSFQGTNKEGSLWSLPLPAGSPRPLGKMDAHSASWAPGGRLLYVHGSEIYEANPDGSEPKRIARFNSRVGDVRVSPNGRTIRITLDELPNQSSFWELDRDGSHPRRLFPSPNPSDYECCGQWTPDGKYFLFSRLSQGRYSIWALPKRRWWSLKNPEPVQLTNGPLDFEIPVPSKDGRKIFALGGLPHSEVLRYDGKSFVPYLSGVSMSELAFSADGERVAYVSVPDQALWISKMDGSARVRLTDPTSLQAALPRWSPDGSQVLFMGRRTDTDWRAYLISGDGRSFKDVFPGSAAGFDPNWSPDGKSIVMAVGDLETTSNKIGILDLETQKWLPLPEGDRFFSPRWSPDGRYIAAITTDSQSLVLFDRTTQQWTELVRMGIGYPSWSRDGQYIYFDSILTDDPAFYRLRVSDHKLQRVTNLIEIHRFWGPNGEWSGLAPDDSLLITRNITSPEIYELDWQD